MAVNRCTFSNHLKAKDLCYSDEFFKLRSEKVIPSDSFSFDSYEAFKNISDYKTNNYSNLFLINKRKNSEWLEAKVKERDYLNGLATTISWYAANTDNELELGSWLYFAKNYEMFDINVSKVDALLTYGKPEKDYSNYIFYLEYLDDNTCRISHTFGDLIFYLSVGEDKVVRFVKNPTEDTEKFIYNIDGQIISFSKKVLHKVYNEVGDIVRTYYGFYTLGVERTDKNPTGILKLYDEPTEDNNIFAHVHDSTLDFNFYIDASWVGYDRSKNISSINHNRSAFGLESQSLIHHQYNKEDGFNFIPLKNNLSYRGNTIRGANLVMSDVNYPDVDFRTYDMLHTGFNQEKGSDTITLSFTFNDQEYEVKDGDDLYFSIPEKSIESTNGLEPLWPFKYININDTKFIKNGAFGSNVPYFADKIKKMQGAKSLVYDIDGKRSTPNNGVYLCSWLYKKNKESEPIWLDRYYYPDIIDRAKALKGESTYDMSFENILDKNYSTDDYLREKIYKNTYIDKVSDLIIEPANTYLFQRLSSDMVNEVLDSIEPYRIKTAKDNLDKDIDLWDIYGFNNEKYVRINYKDWKNTNSINFNTDIYLNKNKRMGIQLFGCDYTSGFNIQNRKDLAPYHYYASETTIYLLNNKFESIHQFDLYQKYEDKIYKMILGDIFDDVIIITGTWLYILTYDLRLKTRIDLTAQDNERFVIKNLEQIKGVKNGKEINLLNYPYGDTHITLDREVINDGSITLNPITKERSIKISRPLGVTRKTVRMMRNSGSFQYPSNLSKLLSESNALFYKNNLYVPMNSKILKIIFCPDCQKDFDVFTEEDRTDYPASCRFLTSQEFVLNYMNSDTTGQDSENVSVESGFIVVENKIKNIFIDENGKLFATNFDKMAISPDGDTIYGLYGQDIYLATGQWFWLFNQSMSKMQADVATSKYAEFASPNSIDAVKFNERGEMCLLRNFHNLIENDNDDNNKRMDIYDKTKKRIYTFDLSSYQSIVSLDAYNFIDDSNTEQTCFTAILRSYIGLYKVTYYSDSKSVTVVSLNLPTNTAPHFYETTNSNVLLRYKDYNALYFNLYVPSSYIYDYIATIKWNLQDIQEGWYNINVMIDLDEAVFEVRVNDIIYETINEDSHSWFLPHVSSNGTVFNNTYTLGCVGKKYGTTLNNILKNSIFDPYICKNSKLEHMQIYNRKLSYYEYQAMRLRGKKINPIILTLPCGNRNGIDEIVRYFKYNSAGAISNKVKINVSGTGLQTEGEFDLVRKEIMNVLEKNVDCLVDVKEIEFI